MKSVGILVWSVWCLIGLMRVEAACSPSDQMCWQNEALTMTNGYRAQAGKKPLGMGTKAQVDNAMKHSGDMMRGGYIYHQQLPMSSEVGCGMWLTGENVAQTWVTLTQGGDHVAACMQLWRDSPGHYQNIISDTPSTVAYGYVISSDGKIFCTQTFGTYVYSPGSGGSCDKYGSAMPSQAPAPTPPPTNPPPPANPSPQGRMDLRGYEFENKPIGSRFNNAWKLPRGLMSTTISTVTQSRQLEIIVAAWWGSTTIQLMWDGQVAGTYTIQAKQVMTIHVSITHGSGVHTLRLDNRGVIPLVVRRARII